LGIDFSICLLLSNYKKRDGKVLGKWEQGIGVKQPIICESVVIKEKVKRYKAKSGFY